MADFTIHTLGCGSARPTTRHNPSATVVEFRNNLFMVDCGEGAQKALLQQHLKISRLGHIFLTHMHGDHVLGLPGLISTLGLQDTGGELTIHTFADGASILKDIFNYFGRNLPYDIRFNILDPKREEVAFENKALTVRTLPLCHRVPAVGFVFEEKPRQRHLNREMCDFHGVPTSQFNNVKGGDGFRQTRRYGSAQRTTYISGHPFALLRTYLGHDTSAGTCRSNRSGRPSLS